MLNQGEICTACHGKYFWRAFFKNCQNSRRQSTLLMIEALLHKWKGSYDFVDLFIAPSNFMADLISQRIPEKKIFVLRNGVDINKFSPTYVDEGYGLYFGRLSKEKGVETFLKAHKILKNLIPIKIVGAGPIEDELKASFPMANFLGYKQLSLILLMLLCPLNGMKIVQWSSLRQWLMESLSLLQELAASLSRLRMERQVCYSKWEM